MTTPIIPPFAPGYEYPLANITPFTYRDGLTYLQRLERLGKYINRVLIPFVQENYDELAGAFDTTINGLITSVNTALANQTALVNDKLDDVNTIVANLEADVAQAVSDITNATIAITDPVVTGLLNNAGSTTYAKANEIAVKNDKFPLSVNQYIPSDYPTNWGPAVQLITTAELEATGLTSVYYPSVVRSPLPQSPGDWMMFWSSNHSSGMGGIGMAFADNPIDPTSWDVHGLVYQDTNGSQTETPKVYLSLDETELIMLYQNWHVPEGNGDQTTCFATSDNGTFWTRGGVAMQGNAFDHPGNNHTGYADVNTLTGGYVGLSLYGGGNGATRTAKWYSRDGKHFVFGGMFVNESDIAENSELRLKRTTMRFFKWREKLWATFSIGTPAAGGGGTAVNGSFVVEMAEDYVTMKSIPVPIAFTPDGHFEYNGDLYAYSLTTSAGFTIRKLI